MDLRFSVCIPTLERPATLAHALRTCVEQRFESYEVIVCDNCSGPATKEVVDRANSPKVKYVRSRAPLAMSDNWELALSEATGEFLLFIGDDDALMPNALQNLDALLRWLGTRVLAYERVHYNWPCSPIPGSENQLSIPLTSELKWLDSERIINRVANGRANAMLLPQLYTAAIHRDIISDLRRRAGRVFGGSSPDIYSGFAFAYLATSYPLVTSPITVAGMSGKSNGAMTLTLDPDNAIARDFHDRNTLVPQLRCHSKAPAIPTFAACVADMFFHAQDAIFPADHRVAINRRQLIINCLKELRCKRATEWQKALNAIDESLEDVPQLRRWFQRCVMTAPQQHHSPRQAYPPLGFDGTRLVFDSSRLNISNVYEAAQAADSLLGGPNLSERMPPVKNNSLYRRCRSAARILLKGQ